MAIQEIKAGDVLVLAPDRSVFARDEANDAETKLAAAIKAGTRFVVLDCTAITQLTSDATRVLLMSSRKLTRLDGRLVLCGINGKLKKAFSVSGFNKDFTVVATRDEAVQRVVEPVQKPVRVAVPPPPRPKVESPAKAAPVDDEPAPDAPTVVGLPGTSDAPTIVTKNPPVFGKDAPTIVGMPDAKDAPTIVGMPDAPTIVSTDAATVVVTKVPKVDPREAQANALFDALGVDVSRRGPSHYGPAARGASEKLAGALLAALQSDRA